MTNFAILVEQMARLKAQYESEKVKLKPNHRLVIDLEHRVKLHTIRMNEYGAKGTLLQLVLEVRHKRTGNTERAEMYLAGVNDLGIDLINLVKWKLKDTAFTFVGFREIKDYELG